MTHKKFMELKSVAVAFQTAEQFNLSFGEMDGEGVDSAMMEAIFAVSKAKNVSDVIKITGLGPAAFAREFDLPLRTLEDWRAGRRTPSEWGFGCLLYMVCNYICEKIEEKREHWDIMINEEMLEKDFASLEEAVEHANYLHKKSKNAVIWVIELEEARDGEETYMGFKKIYELY